MGAIRYLLGRVQRLPGAPRDAGLASAILFALVNITLLPFPWAGWTLQYWVKSSSRSFELLERNRVNRLRST